MKQILLDTHVLVWLASGVKIGPTTLEYIQQANVTYVSTLSILELRLKHAKGKFPEAEAVIASISAMGLEVLDLTANQTQGFSIFSTDNKDPYDNALVTIAINESLALASADASVLSIKQSGLVLINAKT